MIRIKDFKTMFIRITNCMKEIVILNRYFQTTISDITEGIVIYQFEKERLSHEYK